MEANTDGNYNTHLGSYAGRLQNSCDKNTCLGYAAGYGSSGYSGGTDNTLVGYNAGYGVQTSTGNSALGSHALYGTTSGSDNTAIGMSAGYNISTGINNTFIGHDAGTANGAGGVHVTENNRIILGSNAVTNFGCQVALTVHSDERDKTDITDFTKGLDIINALRPVTYRWDSRTRYGTEEDPYGTPDGSKKSDKINVGLIAQEVETVEKANGYASSDDDMLFIHKSTDGLNYGLTYEKLIPVLINAVKELSTKVTALEAG